MKDPPAPRFGRDLTVGSIPRHLVAFSLPMLAGSALQTAYSIVNAVWVGKFLGKTALAAVTVSFPVVFVFIALGAGLTMATNILVAQHYGARDMPALRRVVESSTVLIGALSLLLLAMGELATPAILRGMDTPPDVLPAAIRYMRIFLLSLPLGFGLFSIRSMLQGTGDSTTPLYYLAGSVLLTAILDPVLMFGWLGAPKLGLDGTAWATVIANALALAALVYVLRRRRHPVAPAIGRNGLDWATMWTTIKIGLPAAAQQSMVAIGMTFITGIVNGFGEDATAGFGAAGRIDQLAFMPAMTLSLAISTLTGQNIGAGYHHRVREILLWGCALSGGITLAVSALVVAIPNLLLRAFTDDPAVLTVGAGYLRIVGSSYIFFAIMFVSNGVINGAGHTLVTTLVTLLSLWMIRVPLAYTLAARYHDIHAVWYVASLSFFIAMLSSLAYYLSGRWRRPILKPRLIAPTSPDVPLDP